LARCNKCKQDGLYYHYYEIKQTHVLFDGTEKPHVCPADPIAVQDSVDKFSERYRTKIINNMKIWCGECGMYWDRLSVCSHILRRGFIEGVDTVEYFSDKWDMIEKRKQRIKEMKKKKEAKKALNAAYPVDLRDYK